MIAEQTSTASRGPVTSPEPTDPDFWQARREAMVVVLLFLASLFWTIIVCYRSGYVDTPPAEPFELAMVWGLPAWVFWGIVVPWLLIDLTAVWFCFFYMRDDDSLSSCRPSMANEPLHPVVTPDVPAN